jgi:simple sugar transport system permease protein
MTTTAGKGVERPPAAGTVAPAPARVAALRQRLVSTPEVLPIVLLLVVTVLFWSLNPAFLSTENITGMLAFLPEVGLVALGMTLLLTAGQFDLSAGAVFGFTPLLAFILVNDNGVAFPVAVLLSLAAAGAIGVVNGLLVTRFGISSFLVTLSGQLIISGGALYLSSGFPQPTLQADSWLTPLLVGKTSVGGVTLYVGLLWFLGLAGVLWYLLAQTRYGNWIKATGGNRDAARARGINTDRVTVSLFVLVSVLAGLAGVISAVRIGSAYPTAGTGYELEAIAIAVVGGTSLFGGIGTVLGTVVAAVLLRAIRNGVILIGVPGLAYLMFVGIVILLAMLLQTTLLRFRRPAGKRAS